MSGGHSQNVGLDLAMTLSYALYFENALTLGYFENALTLGLYPTLIEPTSQKYLTIIVLSSSWF